MKLFNVLNVGDTKKVIDDNFTCESGGEKVSLYDCTGKILYRDIVAAENVPPFRRSTVDGYAVYSRDIFGCSETMPAMLVLAGEIFMGQDADSKIKFPGECFYVPTGGMMPEGADSVVMIEYTEKLDEKTILSYKSVSPGENVIEAGEDIKCGETAIKKGTKLRSYEIGVMSSLGISIVDVYKKPKVGIISTGDEIVDCTETPKQGQIRDINTYLLYSLAAEYGCVPFSYGHINDDFEMLKSVLNKAVNECDIVLVSGGSSVGKKDSTLEVINSLPAGEILVHGISIKPGKPTIIGKCENKIIFGLPGHPLACAVIFNVIVKYYIDKMTGHFKTDYPVSCKFKLNYHKAKGREEYLPVTLEENNEELYAVPVFGKSGLITGFSKAWGYIMIERNEEGIKENQIVSAYKF